MDQQSFPKSVDILIVGGGPTGLGAATRLNQLEAASWVLAEAEPSVGGLASSDTTPEGFLFDMGGHVMFSHYEYFDDLLNCAVGPQWNVHERVSFVWIKNRWIPYPLQNNLKDLPVDEQIACINGLIDSLSVKDEPKNFDEWILKNTGKGIADLFMRPYNCKVWACRPDTMQCKWLGERVSPVDVKIQIENILRNKSSTKWGPNATFRFPKFGGTGSVWKSVASLLPKEKIFCDKKLRGIDFDRKIAKFSDGSVCMYNKMILTAPLDICLTWAGFPQLASQLKYSSTHVVGLGIRGANPHDKKCWMYFPEDNCPFYRCTIFSLYSENNCPSDSQVLPTLRTAESLQPDPESLKCGSGPYWSIMFEISESKESRPIDISSVVEETIQGAIRTLLIDPKSEIVSIFHRRLERGYPIPSLSRDSAVNEGLTYLKSKNVWGRGRFGAWKYEAGNQDHSLMQGVEAVDNILFGHPEFTVENPDFVNGRRNCDINYSTDKQSAN